MRIAELGLTDFSRNRLLYAGIDTVEKLLAMPLSQLEKVRDIGPKSLREIRLALIDKGFSPTFGRGAAANDGVAVFSDEIDQDF